MEKKKYIVPEMNAMLISECDIITASGDEPEIKKINKGTSGVGATRDWGD